ncbi:hypothetical protein DOTSEDRAFT_173475 [Dothistroma septosporum NZE10]|uniref:DUF7730 domain-containing protein n=1 Tax=Dothistroma septosporum (strain NZE10 / CBS 128990) TaxID=675120 RepID=M2YLQ7_DOTSN|nr:hypothetical protein DOTSEDRAFT_173475 [Dothistroma septosporum NZE10]
MDTGHYNCRDYYVSPHFAPTTITNDRRSVPLFRHESFDELEQRSRSPASFKPKFPLLQLPLELRQQIFSYLLPRTYDRSDPNPLADHARNFSAVKKRKAKGMIVPKPEPPQRGGAHIVWQRAYVDLLRVCRQIHNECAEMVYGRNTFLLFLTYSGITFRFNYLLPTGMAPSRRFNFLELMPKRYLALVKRVVVNVDHVDSYTGMIKFNVSGKGLMHGLRNQVRRLVNGLQPLPALDRESEDNKVTSDGRDSGTEFCNERRLAKVHVRVSNGNAVLDQIKSQREEAVKIEQDVEDMLAPLGDLRGVRDVAITGAVMKPFAESLRQKMMGNDKLEHSTAISKALRVLELDMTTPQLCVYGNDI